MTPERFHKLKSVLTQRQPDLTVLTADVHKSHNISAVLRTCDATGVYRMHAISPGGELRRHHMIAGGSGGWVDVKIHPGLDEAVQSLRNDHWRLLAAHPSETARDYRDIDYTAKVAIILGSELDGLSAGAVGAADEIIALPLEGMVASLNVSVAAAVILYEAQRQRRSAGLYNESRLSRDEFDRVLFEWAYPEIADRCRSRGLPFPELTDDGEMKRNPLVTPL
jgi:tRNA (guanosine-2'-O-)-methyltransferase